MAAVRKSKSKAKRSPSVSSAHSLEMPVEGDYGNRKRMVSASSNSGSEVEVVEPSPTKRHKKVAPGSPEYRSQPAVVITSKSGPKPLRRKLSFGSLDDDDAALDAVRSVSEATSLEDEGEASPAQNVKRFRKPSQKAVYMASTPARREKEDQVAQKSRRSSGKKQTAKSMEVDTPSDLEIMSGIVAPSPTKKSAPRPTKKTASLPAVKCEQSADVELRSPSPPAPRQSKGKVRARLESPIDISGAAPSPTKKSQAVPRLTRKTASLPAVKREQSSDVELRSPSPPAPRQSKGKVRARLESPIDISSDESGMDQLFVETYRIRPNLSLCSGIDCPVSSPVFSDDTPKAKGRPSATITKAREKHRTLHESPTAVITKDTDMMDGSLSPGDQVQGVADTHSSHLCIIRPTDSNKTPAYAPADLRDPSTDKPIFLQSDVFPSMFEEPALSSLLASLDFKSLPPFVNPSNFPPDGLAVSDYKNLMWPGSKENAVCIMLGAVHSCNIIHYIMAGSNKIRGLSIIPSANAFDSFRHFLWKKYAASEIYGPFDYGCLLTFTSRREGLTSSYGSSQPQVSSVRRKRNMKAFGSSASAPPAALWYEKNFPPFVDYDQDIPIYDARSQPFMFTKDDFATLPSLPRYKNSGDPKNADLPANGLVSVFFSMNTYASARVPPTPGSSSRSANDPQTPVATGSSSRSNASSRSDSNFKVSSQVLFLNLQCQSLTTMISVLSVAILCLVLPTFAPFRILNSERGTQHTTFTQSDLSGMTCPPCRTVAAAFEWISWYTNTVSSFSDLEDAVKPVAFLNDFPNCLQRYESYLLSIRSFYQRDQLVRDLLGIKTTYGVGQPFKVERHEDWSASWSPADAQILCSLICGYRLLDVMALVHGCNEAAPAVPRTFLQNNEQIFDGMEHLHDWPALLLKFRKSFVRSEANSARSSSSGPDAAVRLMRLLSKNLARSATTSIEGNFIVAAMHMAYLTTVHHSDTTIPDLPDSYDALVSGLSKEGPRLRDAGNLALDDVEQLNDLVQVVKDARKASGSNSLVGLRGPLHLGLLVSPIIFASPSTLVKYSYNRLHVLTVAHRLGNTKSELLRRVESVMWNGVILLVSGDKDPHEMLAWLVDTLPWKDIEGAALDENERGWFRLSHPRKTGLEDIL
ncbi:hypothetical protein BDZ97DRAFT_1754747 [Flammula alnicola]|nr:hypothetical protein BDZ97DRAFT_1754747 [Flammula alnicola]